MKVTLTWLLFGLLCVSRAGHTQTPKDGWEWVNVHGPSQVGIVDSLAFDLNGDGLTDVVSVSIDDGHLRAYINQGNLLFEQQTLSEDVPGAYRLYATDLNADGATDFLIPSLETHEILAFYADENQASGYRKVSLASDVLLPTDAQAGDFNGDGLMDVVSLSFVDNVLLLHSQNNTGTFDTEVLADQIQAPRKLQVADFDNDQWPDVLVASSDDHTVRLFNNKAGQGFTATTISAQITGARGLAVCYNTEGQLPDFVVSANDDETVYLFANRGDLEFSSKVLDAELPGAANLLCDDIDGDQQPELISISASQSAIYKQEIEGDFNKQLLASQRDGYLTAVLAQFEPGGPVKLLTQSYFGNRNLLYDPQQVNQEQVVWEDFPDGVYWIESGDIDGDMDMDFAYVAFRQNQVFWAENQASGYQIHTLFSGVDGPQSIKLADLDEDGDLDAITAGAWDDSFWYHMNTGGGVFDTFLITNEANNAARTEVMDVNGDGRLDVIGTSGLDNSVRWYDRNGTQFTAHLIDDQVAGAMPIAIEDFNGDLIDDIAVGSFFGNHITLFFNDGLGQFTSQQVASDKLKPTVVLATDVDADQDIDLVYNASLDQQSWVLFNDQGQYTSVLAHPGPDNVRGMALLDYEYDGDMDLISISDQNGDVYLSLNQGNQVFTSQQLRSARIGGRSVLALPGHQPALPVLVQASNISNGVQVLQRVDLIFANGFE